MLLYEHPLSSFAQKVKIALREKEVPFDVELPESFGTGRRDDAFGSANPRTEVPVLVVDGTPIFESTIILEFIEDSWPDPPLLPEDPLARAEARITEEICDTQYEAVNWGFGEILWFRRATGDLADRLKDQAARQTAVLQDWLAKRLGDGDYFSGHAFGWADVAVAPMLNRSIHYGLGPKPGSRLADWHARICERPSIVATFAEFDAAAAKMASIASLYTQGGRRREYRDHRLEWMVKSGGIDIVLAGLRDDTIRFSWPDP